MLVSETAAPFVLREDRYRDEPGYRGNQYNMTLVPNKPKGGPNKGSAGKRKAIQPLESSSIEGGIRLVLPAKGVNVASKLSLLSLPQSTRAVASVTCSLPVQQQCTRQDPEHSI